MIPLLPLRDTITAEVDAYLSALKETAFSGDIRADFSSRLLTATDNSIYQILPQAVLFPKTTEDVVAIFQLASQPSFQHLTFSPRGGGTGTNGQSLSPGIIIDCSKYMNSVLSVDSEAGWVIVQPGVVLDQLNERLKIHDLFFAPNLSPSSRATIGGMINTDACGKGSRIYGRTSDHILELTWVLTDGTVGISRMVSTEQVDRLMDQPGRIGKIYQQVEDIVTSKEDLIEQHFPKMPRFLTGYNLAKVYDFSAGETANEATKTFDLNRILAGSEGTLAVITEAKLKLSPLLSGTELLVVHYDCFDDALGASQELLKLDPVAIETVDETILELAQQNEIYERVKDLVEGAKAINLVEFAGENADLLSAKVEQIKQELADTSVGCYRAQNSAERKALWDLRKRGAGLLGKRPGVRKPIAFMEDTAVPPVHLPAYVQELKMLLNQYGLSYAMFGHVDVGCLHVRPALDMRSPTDEQLIREISDQVALLVRKYGGVMWAEHGRGFRSEYTPLFFGEDLYDDLRRIKAAFDPHNRLSPGKIVPPMGSDDTVVKLAAPLKGQFDRQVSNDVQASYEVAFNCNGNGACFNVDSTQVMCPSYKGSRDRIHSPKGRASLLREWLRQLANSEEQRAASWPVKVWNSLAKAAGQYDYSHEVYDALHGCLSCKACASSCPIHVNIPSLKAKFLQRYYSRYARSPRDYILGHTEAIAHQQAKFPAIANLITQNPITRGALRTLGTVAPPPLSSPNLSQQLKERDALNISIEKLAQANPNNSVILLADAFTSAYEAPIVLAAYDLFIRLGFEVHVLSSLMSGKALHVLGFIDQFDQLARQNIEHLMQLQQFDIPIVGIEPSLVLTYRDEYASLAQSALKVQLPQEFLLNNVERIPTSSVAQAYQLFGHCNEKALALTSQQQWQAVFEAAGLTLNIVATGCCGMAGLYGYEIEHLATSRSIYQLSWAQQMTADSAEKKTILATGLSCRAQVKRFSGWSPLHPLQALQQSLSLGLND